MCCCDLNHCMSSGQSLAQILAFCEKDQIGTFEQRQIPLQLDENLLLKYRVDDSCLTSDQESFSKKTANYRTFIKGYEKLTNEELDQALTVPVNQITEYNLQNISCVGCRTSIDSFIKSLIEYGHPALEPLVVNGKDSISLHEFYRSNADQLFQLFYINQLKFKTLIDNIPKSKKNGRCLVHSLGKTRSLNDWEFVWDVMNDECQDKITLVNADSLFHTIEIYLKKYKFCPECKLKVSKAYDLLIDNGDCNHRDKKGFCPFLYEGLHSCPNERHIHIDCQKSMIENLIRRAEIEIRNERRERHAKTLDAAQEEVLTCIGIYLFEKFEKIYRVMKCEEQIWKLVFYIGINCLKLNFERRIGQNQDLNTVFENLCEEFRSVDRIKSTKKRTKRKSRKQNKLTEICSKSNEKLENTSNPSTNKFEENVPTNSRRRRTNSCCSCFCHYCDEQTTSFSTILKSSSLIKSHSCPSLLLTVPNPLISSNSLQLSNSLDTLFQTISTRECVCHEKNFEKDILCDECPISSSTTRLDLGYSSEQDDACSSNLCDACSNELSSCCPLHEEDEGSMSVLSSGIYSHNCCHHDKHKLIELSDRTGKSKLTLQLSDDYPFFQMNFKQIWEENPSSNSNNQAFISDADRREFFLLNKNFHKRREQLRRRLKYKFQLWKRSCSLNN